jgi:hypothetical protein
MPKMRQRWSLRFGHVSLSIASRGCFYKAIQTRIAPTTGIAIKATENSTPYHATTSTAHLGHAQSILKGLAVATAGSATNRGKSEGKKCR